jgi:hypothetical protein
VGATGVDVAPSGGNQVPISQSAAGAPPCLTGAELAFKLPNRLTSAQTVPDALSAYQKWLGEWLTLASEDGQHLISDGQKIVDKGVSCFAVASPSIAT